jgi:VIT1/CCC1 family predicted Fe2+/Mn2+ transporter
MARQSEDKANKVLDPIERVTEVIFGALMALTFTGSFSVASPGEEVRTMMWAALGCNLAWGLTDAVMYLIGLKVERQRRVTLLRHLQATQDPEIARQFVRDALPERLAEAASPGVIDALQRTLLEAKAPRSVLHARDYAGALAVLALVVAATFPIIIPFIFASDLELAMRTSNSLAVLIMFIGGVILGHHAGGSPLRYGLAMAGIGVALAAIIVSLGG